MVLVDTSVWIDFVRGRATGAVERLQAALDHGVSVALTSFIYQELLQGADSERSMRELEAYFGGQRFLHPVDPIASHARAARLFFDCRRKGRTVRSTVDCLIAQIAIEHDVALLHDDRDFAEIASVAPKLRFA
jgi:predicted nucleic acid-binding protein